MNTSIAFRGLWSVEAVPYWTGDVVTYEGSTWIAVDATYWWHIPGTDAGAAFWYRLVIG